MGNYKKGLQLSEDPISFFSSKNYPTVAEFQAFELNKLQSTYPPNVSTTPLRQWGIWRQCLPFSWTTLKTENQVTDFKLIQIHLG